MSTPQLVLGLTTFLAGTLLGFGASAWTAAPQQETAVALPLQEGASLEGAKSAPGDVSMLAELRELANAVRANTEALRESPRRAVAGSDVGGLEQLKSQMEALLARTASSSATSQVPSRREIVPVGDPTRDIRSLAVPDPGMRFADHLQNLAHDHLLWSYDEVLHAYGKPDRTSVAENGSVFWGYDQVPHVQNTRTYTFIFIDGLVVDVG